MDADTYRLTVAELGNSGNEKLIDVLVYDYDDYFELKTMLDGIEYSSRADDMFSAFQLLRDKLLESSFGIKCNAAKINAIQSGMMRNQDVVYLVRIGEQARMSIISGIIAKWKNILIPKNSKLL